MNLAGVFSESVNAENLSTHGGVANAKPKYPPDASGGYNKINFKIISFTPTIKVRPRKKKQATYKQLFCSPDKILNDKVTMAMLKVKSRSYYDVAHLHSPNNIPNMYKRSYISLFLRYSLKKIIPHPATLWGKNDSTDGSLFKISKHMGTLLKAELKKLKYKNYFKDTCTLQAYLVFVCNR